MATFAFMYFLETSDGKVLLKSNNGLDDIIQYVDKYPTDASQYSVSLINKGKEIYKRTELLPDLNIIAVRMAFNLDI